MQLPLDTPASVPRRPFAIPLHGPRKSAWILRKLVSEISRLLRPPLGSGSVSDYATYRQVKCCLLGRGKQQLISVGIDDLNHVVTPPGLLGRNRALDEFTAKRGESIDVQCHEQARLVCSRGILAKDDLASRAMDLADPARAVALMPTLLEAEHVDVEPKCAVHVSNEEHGTRVPPVSDLLSDGCLGHAVPDPP